MNPKIRVIIPAYNEANAINHVIKAIPKSVAEIVVVDNGSEDLTSETARKAGATVLFEPNKGYG
ncbi:MAG: glycosyltransferase, partial [Flavobacteriaceae bacterium]|nr:glycosyltransferase [Flavobacteriaceae bacterium]